MAEENTKFVRLKPYNPRTGHVLRRYHSIRHRIYIRGDRGWHEVSEADAEFLATVCTNGHTEEENEEMGLEYGPAFDVADSVEDIKAMERAALAREQRRRGGKAEAGTADNPVRVSRPGRKKRKKPAPKKEKKVEKREPTADEIAEARQARIDALVEENDRDEIKKMVEEREIEISLRKKTEDLAAAVVDHDDAEKEFGED